MTALIRWIDKTWLAILVVLIFVSPLVMLRTNGQHIITEIAPTLQTAAHYAPEFTNLLFKEIFCQALILILLYLTLAKKALTGNWKFTRSSMDIPIFVFLLISAISLFYSATRNISFRDWGVFASFILFYYLILDQLQDKRKIKIVLWTVVASAIVTAFLATCQHLKYFPNYLSMVLVEAGDRNRMSATIGHNNGVASYMMMASFVLVSLQSQLDKSKKFLKWGLYTLLIWFMFVILATLSRGVWIGTFVGTMILLFFSTKKMGFAGLLKKYWLHLAGGLVLFILFISILSIKSPLNPIGVSIVQRFKDTVLSKKTYLQDDRIRMWASSFQMIKEHPLRGVGLGAFKYWIPVYQGKYFATHPDSKLEPTFKLTNQSHNEYIQSWAELGILGFMCGLCLLFYYLRLGFTLANRNYLSNIDADSTFYLALFCATVGVLCQALVDFPLHVSPLALLFLLLGAIHINQDKIKNFKEEKIEIDTMIPKDFVWLGGLIIVTIVSIFPGYNDLKADFYKNRMDYFLQAAEEFTAARAMELREKALIKAVEYGNLCVSLDPHNGATHYYMGLGYLKLQAIPEAVNNMELALRDMQYAELHFNLADGYEWQSKIYSSQGDSENTRQAILNAIDHYHMAAFIYPLNTKQAEEAHQKNIFYMPTEAMHREGVLLMQLGKTNEGLKVMSKIIPKDPNYLNDKYTLIARKYRWNNDFKTAIRILEQGFSLDTNNSFSLYQVGMMYFEAGEYNNVIPILDKLTSMRPTDTTVYMGYALVYEKLNQKDKAIQWAQTVLQMDPVHQDAIDLVNRMKKNRK